MKIFNLSFVLIFILFAGLQYNDPDPYIWMPVYLYAAVFCYLAFRGRFYPNWYWAGIAVYFGYAVYLFFTKDGIVDWVSDHHAESITESMKATKPWIEETREFFGLVILMAVLGANLIYAARKRKISP